MSRRTYRPRKKQSFSDRFRAWRRAVLMRAGGAAMIVLAGWLAAALATFSISDPSFNTATQRGAENLAGAPGAAVADLLLQTLGGASLMFVAPLAVWGAFALAKGAPETTPPAAWLRAGLAPVSALAAAGFASSLPSPATWPFAAGLGGVAGDAVLNALSAPFAALGAPAPAIFAGAAAFVIALPAYLVLCGLTRERAAAATGVVEDVYWAAHDFFEDRIETLRQLFERSGRQETDEPPEADSDAGEPPLVAPARRRNIIRKKTAKRAGKRERREAQPELPVFEPGTYELPPLHLLAKPGAAREAISDEALEQNARMLENVLADFGVRGEIINVRPGPVVTLYELEPAAGVKSSRVIGLADDIARSMSAVACRVAVVPGRNVIGIELPNQDREMVYLRELLGAAEYEKSRGDLTLALGKGIGGEPVYADLARMPHLLIAGTTGSGKSVGINTMILSLLYRLSPDECKLILVDPKMLELSVYEGIPHLLAPVVTDPKKAVGALKWTVREMEERYRKMSKVGVRNIEGFNQRIAEAKENGETLTRTVHTGYDEETGEPVYETEELDYEAMPFIVVVIDEVADLMMVAGKDIEAMVQRLAQMARAAGIHLIMATQRPSVDVVTGTIKANLPTRISFQVTSRIDSRTILGEQGAEQLVGLGDMLHMAGGGRLRRVHGGLVSDDEVEKIVRFLKKQGKPDYVQAVTQYNEEDGGYSAFEIGGDASSGDALYDKAVATVLRDRKVSTSYIQRRLQIGYNRAATLIERMEEEGLISPANHAGKREILVGEDAA
ncbi:MAG: DNA translocase FtsK 4TM domain-containing protein [Parvularculaceae bacterium]